MDPKPSDSNGSIGNNADTEGILPQNGRTLL